MENNSAENIELSVIIWITERYDPVKELFHEYKRELDATGLSYEIIYVLAGDQSKAMEELNQLQNTETFTIVTLAKWFGMATALNAAFSESSGQLTEALTLHLFLSPLMYIDFTNTRNFPLSNFRLADFLFVVSSLATL